MSHYGSDPKVASKATIKCNREAIDSFWPARAWRAKAFSNGGSGGQKVSVSPCGSVANKKRSASVCVCLAVNK